MMLRCMPSGIGLIILGFCLLCLASTTVLAAGELEAFLPPTSCGAGWQMEGKPLSYDRETLSDRINGEAELYFPYGFDRMAAARYVAVKNSDAGIDVEIYRMGSLLDAFGMYANYRQKDGRVLPVGAEANSSPSQFYFYQGPFFVHIQQTGAATVDEDTLLNCAKQVASRIPGTTSKPTELAVFDRPEVVKGTERYLPQSLLGYDFLNRGILADAQVAGTNFQLFLILNTSAESAAAAFDRYRSQLTKEKIVAGVKGGVFLEGIDPLYGTVVLMNKAHCLAGALKFSGKDGIHVLLESVCR